MKKKPTLFFLLAILFGNLFHINYVESEEDLENYQIWVVTLNNNITPLDNKLVRQAMNYAIDKKAIKEKYDYPGVVATGIIPPGMPGYRPNREELYPYNPRKAKELLKEAGYSNGLKVEIYKDRDYQNHLVDIANYLENVGFDVEINKKYDWNEILRKAEKGGNIPMWGFGWVADWVYPDNFLENLCKSGNPITNYKNEEIDNLLEQAKKTSDEEKQLELYQMAEDICTEDAPYIFLIFYGQFAEDIVEYEKTVGIADKALEEAKSLLQERDPETAIEKIESSLKIYIEYDESNMDKFKECDSLFKQAIELYNQSGISLLDDEDFENAKVIFENLKDYIDDHLDLLGDAGILTNTIENEYKISLDEVDSNIEKCNMGLDAMKTYDRAINFYNSGYYDEAKSEFEQAKQVFESIDSKGMYKNASDYIEKCDLAKEARSLLEQGKSQFVSNDYERAKLSFEQAKEKYKEIGMSERVEECDEWLKKIESEEKKAGIGIWAVLIGFILTIGFLRGRW